MEIPFSCRIELFRLYKTIRHGSSRKNRKFERFVNNKAIFFLLIFFQINLLGFFEFTSYYHYFRFTMQLISSGTVNKHLLM